MSSVRSSGTEAGGASAVSEASSALQGAECPQGSTAGSANTSGSMGSGTSSAGDVLFVGGVSAGIVGYDMHECPGLSQLAAKGSTISLSVSVTPGSSNVMEVFGPHISSTGVQTSKAQGGPRTNDSFSWEYSSTSTLRCAVIANESRKIGTLGRHRLAFVPVLLQSSVPLKMTLEEWKEYVEKEEASVVPPGVDLHASGEAPTSGTESAVKHTEGHKDPPSAEEGGQKRKEPGYLTLSCTLALHLHLPSSAKGKKDHHTCDEESSTIPLATTTTRIRSVACHAKNDLCSIVRLVIPAASLTAALSHNDNEASSLPGRKKSGGNSTSSGVTSKSASGRTSHTAGTDKHGHVAKITAGGEFYSFSVALRVISVGQKIGAMIDADEQVRKTVGNAFAGLPRPLAEPSSTYRFLTRDFTPYGAIPLPTLFHVYQLFCEHSYYTASSFSSRRHRYMLLDQTFWCSSPELLKEGAAFPYRWNVVTTCGKAYMARDLIGDMYLTPLLLTLSHCTNIRHLFLSSNRLGDVTCARISELFSHHRYLSHIELQENEIYDCGAMAVLRLVRRNRRIVSVDLARNPCEDSWIRRRIQKVAGDHGNAFRDDPLNVFSPAYSYLSSPSSLTPEIIQDALLLWAHLTVMPLGDIDVWPRNSTTEDMDQYVDESILPRLREGHRMAEAPHSIIPLVARAPLLSELIRTVYKTLEAVVPDTIVRALFMDVAQMECGGVTITPTTASSSGGSGAEGGSGSHAPSPTSKKKASSGNEGVDEKGKDTKRRSGSHGRSSSTASSSGETADNLADVPLEVWASLQLDKVSKQAGPLIRVDELYSISFLRIIVTTFRALEHQFEWEEVAMMLRKVGQRQVSLGVRLEDYWLAIHAFMRALNISLEGSSSGPALPSLHEDSSLRQESISSLLVVMALGLRTALSGDVGITA